MEALATIRHLRHVIMPPFTFDDDESTRADSEYLEFYTGRLQLCLEKLHQYRAALSAALSAGETDELAESYFLARAQFVPTIPFCLEGFPEVGHSECDNAKQFVRQAIWHHKTFSHTIVSHLNLYSDLIKSLAVS